ncbi:unknown [Choristoneura occidentalis granulovirus]|uniref:ORF2 n=2 Tax=Betabaculovirus chofumiferanae TaxID=3051997 RepID=Q999Y6_GVCF|nr:unknown [Choristoneura fumiferana granulovirus]AAG50436.1 ORF2 [Choristoneura fumiferana granulovirus]ABC61136.1 unknown [Choristoneura fumiferana granulovirus]
MDLLGFIKSKNYNADVRDTIKLMKWNNSLKRKLNTETDDNVLTLTVEELTEFLDSVYNMIIKICKSPTNKVDVAKNSSVAITSSLPKSKPASNNINVIVCDKMEDLNSKIVDTQIKLDENVAEKQD